MFWGDEHPLTFHLHSSDQLVWDFTMGWQSQASNHAKMEVAQGGRLMNMVLQRLLSFGWIIYISLYLIIYFYIYIYLYIYISIYLYIYIYICIYIYIYVHICAYSICIFVYIQMYVCIYIYMCVCRYIIYVYIYTCNPFIYIYIFMGYNMVTITWFVFLI